MNNIDTFYPLSPMQQGMLFHELLDRSTSIYLRRLSCVLEGDLDTVAFRSAWEQAVQRIEIFRTSLVWEGLKEPVQVVHREVVLPWAELDWSDLPRQEQSQLLADFDAADQTKGVDLTQPPLMRIAIIRTGVNEHRFIWTLHHIILDGWSMPLVLQQVFAAYESLCANKPVFFESPRPFRDYIVWLKQQDKQQAEDFWKEYLSGMSAPTILPIEQRAASEQGPSFAKQEIWFSAERRSKLVQAARRCRVTLNTLVQGTWAVLLSRYSADHEVLFGSTVAGRPTTLSGADTMVGCFINTVPVRVSCSGEMIISEWLQNLQRQQAEAREYEYVSLADIHAASAIPHGEPLFSSVVVVENFPAAEAIARGSNSLRITQPDSIEWNSFPLCLQAFDGAELLVSFLYDRQRYSDPSISRMMGHFRQLLEGITADPQQTLRSLPLLTAEEQNLLQQWNSTCVDYGCDSLVPDLIQQQAERSPNHPAVRFEAQELTYAELNARANQLAWYIKERAGRDTLVGVCMERSLDLVVALLGTMKAGAAYVPLDPDYPAERLDFMLQDSQVPLLITQQHLLSRLAASGTETFCIDRDADTLTNYPTQPPSWTIAPDDLAYVIYTSGSTGRPKGAMNIHRALLNRLLWMQAAYPLTPADRVLQKTPFSFDVSVWEFFWPLMFGAQLVVGRPGGHRDSKYLADLIVAQEITTLHFVPSMLHAFLQERSVENCTTLRQVICSGEALPFELQQRFFEKLPAALHNLYGPTEASIDVTHWTCQRSDNGGIVPIGRPIANTQIHILDTDLHTTPIGIPGELHIGGIGLARGYWRRRELTAEKFIPDPFSNQTGARLYKTGDRARFLENGTIEYLGRIDFQLKIRGLRVELGEIEATLAQYPGIKECVVVAAEPLPGDTRLHAYFVSEIDARTDDLREFLRRKLPEYMVPSVFMRLSAMPLSPNGKLDRRALPQPDAPVSTSTFVPPRTPVEELLCSMWCDVLRISSCGVHDDFFELGGHSLLAMQVATRLADVFGFQVPIQLVLEESTVERLAKAVEALQLSHRGARLEPILPVDPKSKPPLSFGQQRLWFLDQLEPGLSTYVLPISLRLHGPLNLDALKRSLDAIVDRHQVLRSVITLQNAQPVQVVRDDVSPEFTVIDWSDAPTDQREGEIMRLATEYAQRPFDLSSDLMMRTKVVRMSPVDHVLLISMHHIASDGVSVGIFIRELSALYEAFSSGAPSPLSPLPIQYAAFSKWQRNYLQGETLEKSLSFWKKALAAPLPVLELPTDFPRPAVQTFRGSHEPFEVSPAVMDRLRVLGRTESSTVFMTLLTTLFTLLRHYSGQEDIIVGAPLAGRTRAETDGLIGFFVNTLPIRCDLSGGPSFRELLLQVRRNTLAAYAHQDLPFEVLVDALQPERDLSRTPLFQVMLVPQGNPLEALTMDELQVTPMDVESGVSKFDIVFYVWEEKGSLQGRVEYNTDVWQGPTIKRMVGHFQQLLRAVAEDPEQPITHLPLLTATERRQLLVEWNQNSSTYEKARCVHELFDAQASQWPDRLALASATTSLTYAELSTRANQLANYLRHRGVGPESLVGICMQRSVDMIVALLAVLKAGAAYVPLDPAYPPDRLAFMLEDAAASVLLTQYSLLETMPANVPELFCLDTDWGKVASECAESPAASATPENLAYVIYTSGSTGQPKGVAVQHSSLLNLISWHQQAYGVTPNDRATQLAGQAFDASVWEIWPYLTAGASIHIPDDDVRSSPSDLLQWFVDQEISLTFLPTPPAETVLEHELPRTLKLRALLTGGDRLRRSPNRKLPFRFVNHYGPTENTVVATCCDIDPFAVGSLPIGRPLPNTQAYVLDQRLQPVPIGVPGTLYVGGESLARGYHNRPQLTAEKFVPNPFRDEPGARMYNTGDLVRFRADGLLEFLGRADHQVKVHGYRIELGEIETCLAEHPLVRQCVTMVREDPNSHRRIVAFVGSDATKAAEPDNLRAFLKKRLPHYMVPSAFILVPTFPLTANGKVDRDALAALDIGNGTSSEDYVPPRSAVEKLLCEIWAQVLNVSRIGIHDNFFERGGDSILSIQAASKANQAGLRISAKQIFQNQTIAQLAAVADSVPQWAGEQGVVKGPVPLTPIQSWFFDQNFENPHHFSQAVLLQVHRPFEVALMKQVVQQLLKHHDALRLRFSKSNGTWQQQNVGLDSELPFSHHELSAVPADQRTLVMQEMASEIQQSLNLEQGQMTRFAWFDFGPEQPARLLWVIHHLACDGVSWRILLDHFAKLCSAFAAGEKPHLPRKSTSYKQWAEGLSSSQAMFEHERDYWLSSLDAAAKPVPFDGKLAENTINSASSVQLWLDRQETSRLLQETPARYRAHINELFLTALGAALCTWVGSSKVLVDVEGHGREETLEGVDLSRTVGWFTTIYPVLLESYPDASPVASLKKTKERVRSIPTHGMGYGVLRYLADEASRSAFRNGSRANVLFNYLGQFDQALTVPWLTPSLESLGPMSSPQNRRPYLLEVTARVHGGCLSVEWTYSQRLHSARTIKEVAEHFMSALRDLIAGRESSSLVPTDFAAAKMTQKDLDKLITRLNPALTRKK